MRIGIIGTGYVGLVTGACLADLGHDVVCVDKDAAKIAQIRSGHLPLYEPGLDGLVAANVGAGRLRFTTEIAQGLSGAQAIFIAVGTPARREDGNADLSHVHEAVAAVARVATAPVCLVVKSTVPVGTGDTLERIIAEANPRAHIAVVSNPEFLRQGAAIGDFRQPDRIVIGTDDSAARALLLELYAPLHLPIAAFVLTGRRSAELIKYAANAFLAMKITFINEMADLCEKAGGDVLDVAHGIGLDARIGAKFLNPGPGFGGSCFPKDTMALARSAQDHGSPMRLIETTIAINEQRKRAVARKIIAACGGDVRGKSLAILGLTFKPDTDDMREAPAIAIILALLDAGARIRAFDPAGMETARLQLPDIAYGSDAYDAARGAHGVVLVTEWPVFRSLDLSHMRRMMAGSTLVDLRNFYRREEAEASGLCYTGIGQAIPLREQTAIAAE